LAITTETIGGFEQALQIRHNPQPMANEQQFYRVATVSDILPQSGKTVSAGNQEIALFNLDGTFYAVNDLCPHRGASLGEGYLQTGRCGIVPELKVSTYEVKIEGEQIFVLL
jgi:nitrite reductase/ring-hydroxylating ferredoxin subunit